MGTLQLRGRGDGNSKSREEGAMGTLAAWWAGGSTLAGQFMVWDRVHIHVRTPYIYGLHVEDWVIGNCSIQTSHLQATSLHFQGQRSLK